MSTLTISVSDKSFQKLQHLAQKLHVAPEELVRASLEELLARPEEEFKRALGYVLQKNAELYRLLA